MSLDILRNESKTYAQEKAQEIIDSMIKYRETETKISTCDASNWDRKLHRNFNNVANELRRKDLKVSSKVNWGVTDWYISV